MQSEVKEGTMTETLGEAHDLGWKVRVRCAFGKRGGMKSIRECTFNAYLDLPTTLWTRGREMPLTVLDGRLKCPACGSREVSVLFIPPAGASRQRAQA
jgi:hypothetical protein